MGNKYEVQILRTIDPAWQSIKSKVCATLPRNPNKNKRKYNDTDNTQHSKFFTLPNKKNNKPLREVCEPQNKVDEPSDKKELNTLALCEAGGKVELPLLINSTEHNKHLATWNGKSLNKDELYQLKTYIDKQNITVLCIIFIRPIDYKNGLKPLFEGVVSQSPTIDKLCINIEPTANKLDKGDISNLLSCAIEGLRKSEGEYLKNIYIGSNTPKFLNIETIQKVFEAIRKVTKNTHLKSKTHYLKISIIIDDDFKLNHEYKKQFLQKMQFKIISCNSSDTDGTHSNRIEFSEQTYPSKLSIFKKFCNTTIRNISSNKSAYEEEDYNASISTTHNQDSSQDHVVSGDSYQLVDNM